MGSGPISLYCLPCEFRFQELALGATHDIPPPCSLTLQMCAGTFALSPAIGDRPAAFIISWAVWTISDHQRSSTYV